MISRIGGEPTIPPIDRESIPFSTPDTPRTVESETQ